MRVPFIVSLIIITVVAKSQTIISLYPKDSVPNSWPAPYKEIQSINATTGDTSYTKVSEPTLEIYLPEKEKASGTAMVICPGGGYSGLAYTKEGSKVARAFANMGVAAFILKYRLPADSTMKNKTIGPLQDAQSAIKMVRMRAAEWGIDPGRVGIAGFSAGGHLASTAGTHFTTPVIANREGTNLRPSFMILIYPVISFADTLMHAGSRNRLLGEKPSEEMIRLYSNELQVTTNTPPTFIIHSEDDKTVKVANAIYFYMALLKNAVPAEMHVYPKGGHGFGINNTTNQGRWMERCYDWMKASGWLK
ncbi:MAG TPA: alpha/beta hydrolase [Chitinophagaceae bacterium]|jgi:acetyl esterase/lipase|nr:alpha/beta hydrolase [Chitinophagaceae bacterium]